MTGELRKRLERCRSFGDVTKNRVVYDYELAGPNGAAFELFREPTHGDLDIENAKADLRASHDVVSICVTVVSQAELDAPIPPEPVRHRRIEERETRPFHTIWPNDVEGQQIYFQERFWRHADGDFPHLLHQDIGKRLVLNDGVLQMENQEQLIERMAAFTEFPRGGDVVRIAAPWKWAGPTLKIGSLGFIDGSVNSEYLLTVQITFNSVPFTDWQYCSASGGPGSIATPVSELKPTHERVQMTCWMWKDGFARAHNGAEYLRTCRVWDWYPGE